MTNPLNRLSIRTRIGLLTGLALCVFAVAGIYGIRASVATLERVHGEQVVETGGVILAQMGTIVSTRMDQIARAGEIEAVRRALAVANTQPDPGGTGDRTSLFAEASAGLWDSFIRVERRLFGRAVFDVIRITDAQGYVVADTTPFTKPQAAAFGPLTPVPAWWREAAETGRAVIGVRDGPEDSRAGLPGLEVAVRLDAPDGRLIGIAHATLSAAWIAREAATATQLRQPSDILLTTADGRVIFSRLPFRFLASVADRPVFQAADAPQGIVVQSSGNDARLIAHATNPNAPVIGDLGWRLFISADREAVLAESHQIQVTMLVVFSAVLVGATLLTVLLVLSLVQPLTGLQRAARTMADGDLSARVWPRGRDELADLGHAFNTMADRIEEGDAELRALAVTDPLTGVLNRRGFLKLSEAEWDRNRRHGHSIAVLVMDIDHFKVINDTHGHDVGDVVLAEVAARLIDGVRTSDVIGRLGGEEFAIVLPETPLDAATTLAERLRADIAATPCATARAAVSVTASIGVAHSDGSRESSGFAGLLKRADDALYTAKHTGRNRVQQAAPTAA
ncbi:sensor domain-containing diguanylate cyclase [Roseospira navarrensis]|uniref:diguanylate cyclase n=1 Tax=Roseospira navarrensis TaxID=140058 RepID=A0A7X2D4F8_9PROT|nr:diguanylate cyclase [Roseospira navarrensis]MQX37821.1 diguanylate cyclase [Roseospira navarrensis]